jgi:hypothetical protein
MSMKKGGAACVWDEDDPGLKDRENSVGMIDGSVNSGIFWMTKCETRNSAVAESRG